MSFADDPEEAPEFSFELRNALQQKGEELEVAAHKIGLHATSITMGQALDPHTGQPGQLVLMGQFQIGELAFSDRVQDPEGAAHNDEFARMQHDMTPDTEATRASLEALRARMRGESDGPATEEDATEA